MPRDKPGRQHGLSPLPPRPGADRKRHERAARAYPLAGRRGRTGIWVILTIGSWAVWGVVLKIALHHGDPLSLILWSSVFSAVLVPVNWLVLRHMRVPVHTSPELLLWAACGVAISAVAAWSYPLALSRGSASIVTALTAAYPAGTLLLAAVWLGERPTPLQVAGILLTTAGIMLLAR